mmetsp:Transcript_25639/g.59941  ORF Transcript_25639/g.59941 Transcript_25639/m.59941 type:complete len:88 (-) Transcript_25639:341-604(-)
MLVCSASKIGAVTLQLDSYLTTIKYVAADTSTTKDISLASSAGWGSRKDHAHRRNGTSTTRTGTSTCPPTTIPCRIGSAINLRQGQR